MATDQTGTSPKESTNENDALTEEFLVQDFDVEAYAQKILETGTAVSEQLAVLASNTVQLDKQLRKQISAHHEKLLTQATSIESLEDILETLGQHITTLKSNMDRATSKTGDLFKKTELRTKQLERLHHTCNLLRAMIRVMFLSGKLQHSTGTAGGRDMVKGSQMLQELTEITEELDLRGLEVVEKDLALLPRFTKEVREQARNALGQGLQSQNHSLVGNALQAFANMKCLKQELDRYLMDLQDEVVQCLRGLGKGGAEKKESQASEDASVNQSASLTGTKKAKGTGPGGATLQSAAPSSVVVRANLWTDVQRLADSLLSTHSQLDVLRSVLSKKKDAVSHRPLSDALVTSDGDKLNLFGNFWTQMGKVLGKEFSDRSGLVKQTLESEYPKLLRQLADVLNKIRIAQGETQSSKSSDNAESVGDNFRKCLSTLEQAYLSKSLSRLFDSVNLGFSDDSPPSSSEIENIGQVAGSEMQVTAFDAQLFAQVCKNVAKTVKLFGVKSEQLLSVDGEASQIIGNPSSGQKRNVAVVNALHQLRQLVLTQLSRLQSESLGTVRIGDPKPSPEAVTTLIGACDALLALMGSAINPLLQSVEDAISAIIDTVHQEDFGFELPSDPHASADQQCSLYMRELQDFVTRVWQDHLAPFTCREFVYEQSAIVARKACRQFLIHASLVRPIGEGGRLRLAADFAQMELAVSPLCRRLSSDLGYEYVALRSLRRMLFQTPAEMTSCEDIGKDVPYWLVMHLLISQSPEELPSPHITAGWSLTRYSEWLEQHPGESDRLQFLRGTLEAYVQSVQTQNKTEYVYTYPLLVDLLKRGVESVKLKEFS